MDQFDNFTDGHDLVYLASMILPLDLLEEYDGNMYELTCAAIRRAYQLTVTGDQELEENQGKVVSTAIQQILTRKVEYRIEQ